jgi:tRNA pseudouridine55 synthase
MRPAFDGFLVIDKPSGMTSRDVVNRAQTWFPRNTRIGHTGTLDPLATGVLVLAVGLGTRLTEYVQHMAKVYSAGVRFGATSDTDDADGTITPTAEARAPSRDEVVQTLAGFVGEIEQVPPAYSAAKVTGRRAYDLARKGHEVSLAPRRVMVYAIDVLTYDYPQLELQMRCGKGTYIRSLARDAGQRLGCGGYITSLRRLQVGCFEEGIAFSLEMSAAEARSRLLPLALAVNDLPRITLPASAAALLLHGGSIPLPRDADRTAREAALFDETGRLLAVVEIVKGMMRPSKVLTATASRA